jgi:hypothetical protein
MSESKDFIEYNPVKKKLLSKLLLPIIILLILSFIITISIFSYNKINNDILSLNNGIAYLKAKANEPVVIYKNQQDNHKTSPSSDSNLQIPISIKASTIEPSIEFAKAAPPDNNVKLILQLIKITEDINRNISFKNSLENAKILTSNEKVKQLLFKLDQYSEDELLNTTALYALLNKVYEEDTSPKVNSTFKLEDLKNSIVDLISIKKIDIESQQKRQNTINKANKHLIKNELNTAIKIIEEIGNNDNYLNDWLIKADKLKAVQEILESIYVSIAQAS